MYKEMGMYYKMVKSYKDSFKNVHIIFYEDFRDNIKLEMEKVYNFLEISKNVEIDLNVRYNVGGKRWKSEKMKHIFIRDSLIKSGLKLVIPLKFRRWIRNILLELSTNKVVEMKKETRNMLNECFKEDIKKLSELLNKDLQHWTH